MVISVLLVTSREEEMKFISQLSVPLFYGQIHLVSTFLFRLSGTLVVLRVDEAISIEFSVSV